MQYRYLRFPQGKPKAVTFSYDDGCQYDIQLAGIADRYGIKCTFNLCSGLIAQEEGGFYLTEKQIREHLLASGHEIAVHGEFHKAPGSQRPIEGIKDVLNCRLSLEQRFDRLVRGMAYPDSGITCFENEADYSRIRRYLSDLGIVYSRSLSADNDHFRLPNDWYNWIPTAHHGNPQLDDYIRKFNEDFDAIYFMAMRVPKLFYLWGHSYEFDNNNNWDLFESICERLGNRDDVWYATNGEIYDYVNAYHSLIIRADGCTLYNPTLYTIWFEQDKKDYCIHPGETLKTV